MPALELDPGRLVCDREDISVNTVEVRPQAAQIRLVRHSPATDRRLQLPDLVWVACLDRKIDTACDRALAGPRNELARLRFELFEYRIHPVVVEVPVGRAERHLEAAREVGD